MYMYIYVRVYVYVFGHVHVYVYVHVYVFCISMYVYMLHVTSGYTYMAVWVGGLEVWEIRVMCKIDLKKFFCVCFVFVLFFA